MGSGWMVEVDVVYVGISVSFFLQFSFRAQEWLVGMLAGGECHNVL